MPDNAVPNPGVTPTPGSPQYGEGKPRLGEGEEAQEPKPFALPPEGGKAAAAETKIEHPSPMEVAGDAARQQPQMAPEELSHQIKELQNKFSTIQSQLSNSNITDKFSDDHYKALEKVTDKMTPDMRTIAKNSDGEFNPPQRTSGDKALKYVSNWIDGSQGTLGHALNYLQETKHPDIASFLRLQYSVQRATQRGELFASIVGASVSGIKTLMSTQLG